MDDLPVPFLAFTWHLRIRCPMLLRRLKRQASKEQDPDRLSELVAQMGELLDIIEERLAELQGRKSPSH